jgi:hypothetical protein
MRRQFYGDRRDHIKLIVWDELWRTMMRRARTAYIPMMTADQAGAAKRVMPRAGDVFPAAVLEHFKSTMSDAGLKGFRKWFPRERYFGFCDCGAAADLFTDAGRFDYFARIPTGHLSQALVFLDPDTGTASRARPLTASLASAVIYDDEVVSLWSRATEATLLIYQHLQKDAHKRVSDVVKHGARLKEQLGPCEVAFLIEEDLGFLVIADRAASSDLRNALSLVLSTLAPAAKPGTCVWGVVT